MENTIFGSYTKHEWKKGGKWGALVCSKSGDEKCHIRKPKRDNQKKKQQQQQHTWVWIRAALYNLDSPAAKRCIMFLLPSTKDDVSANGEAPPPAFEPRWSFRWCRTCLVFSGFLRVKEPQASMYYNGMTCRILSRPQTSMDINGMTCPSRLWTTMG